MTNIPQPIFPLNIPNKDMEKILSLIAEQLDMPDSLFEKVTNRYESLSRWLERDESIVVRYKPNIYVQGSFSLGTMIRPLNDSNEFDIDCVCNLALSSSSVTQKQIKECVGKEIHGYVSANNFKKNAVEWEKCWTIEYTDENYTFKIDVVPSLPDTQSHYRLINEARLEEVVASTAIKITDRTRWNYSQISDDWLKGNPKGYVEWFKGRMRVRLSEMKTAFAKNSMGKMAAEEVPDYKIKTPLQKSIQLLKRHRDSYFQKRNDSPSSIVLTTLAAKSYNNEPLLTEALENIINKMGNNIEQRGNGWWVLNPVDPTENFADSWTKEKADAFWEWLNKLKEDWAVFCQSNNQNQAILLENRFGSSMTKRAYDRMGLSLRTPSRFNVPQRKNPPWKINISSSVSVQGMYSINKNHGSWTPFQNDSAPLSKGWSLRFYANTNVPKPYDVYWQVVNTGEEAETIGQLRGEFNKADSYGAGGLNSTTVKAMRDETTQYKGMHWVECFIVKNGICVARSEPFVVNIK